MNERPIHTKYAMGKIQFNTIHEYNIFRCHSLIILNEQSSKRSNENSKKEAKNRKKNRLFKSFHFITQLAVAYFHGGVDYFAAAAAGRAQIRFSAVATVTCVRGPVV